MNAPFYPRKTDLQARMERSLGCHRFPWTEQEESILLIAKGLGDRHKVIARLLKRTPRSVDQHIARLRERGIL